MGLRSTAVDEALIYNSPLKLRPFLELAEEAGLGLEALLARHGSSKAEMVHPETRLPRSQCVAIMQDLLEALGDPLSGLHASERFVLKDVDVVGYLVKECPSTLAALEALSGYSRLLGGDASQVEIERTRGEVIVAIGLSGGRTTFPEIADYMVGSTHVGVCLLHGGPVRLRRVELARPRPDDARPYRRFFGAEVSFEHARGKLVYAESTLLARRTQSDARLLTLLRRQADARLQSLPRVSDLREHVRESLGFRVVSFVLAEDGTLGSPTTAWDAFPGFADGIAVDANGVLYVSDFLNGAVVRQSDEQAVIHLTGPASLAFRGGTLLVTDYRLNAPTTAGGLHAIDLGVCGS